jgi:hypothetical protein
MAVEQVDGKNYGMDVKRRGRWKRRGSQRDERVKQKRESWCAFLCCYAKKRACVAKRTWTKERGKGAEVGSGSSSGSRPNWHWDCLVLQVWTARSGDDQDKARAWRRSVFCACRWKDDERRFIYNGRSQSCASSGRWLVPTGLSCRGRHGQINLPWPGSCRSRYYSPPTLLRSPTAYRINNNTTYE